MSSATVNHLSGLGTHGRHYNETLWRLAMPQGLEARNQSGQLPVRSCMEYRGFKYTLTRDSQPDVWRWRTVGGDPAVLRMGEELSQLRAEFTVRQLIDCAISQAERSKPVEPF